MLKVCAGEIMAEMKCSSCKTPITNIAGTARFLCPACGKTEIIRCKQCRKIAAKYRCHACSFEGPN